MSVTTEPLTSPSVGRGKSSRSVVGARPKRGVLVPASRRGDDAVSRRSSVTLVLLPQFAKIRLASVVAVTQVPGETQSLFVVQAASSALLQTLLVSAGVKVRVLLVLLMTVICRDTPSSLYSIRFPTAYRVESNTTAVLEVPTALVWSQKTGALAKTGVRETFPLLPK